MIRIGVICPSEIAVRRFLPALVKDKHYVFVGVACADKQEWDSQMSDEVFTEIRMGLYQKCEEITQKFGGRIFQSYHEIIESGEIDVIYLPLPPGLHYKWARKALENGVNVFVEKPATTIYRDTEEIVNLAKRNKLALHENYMFAYHSQILDICQALNAGTIGKIRQIRIDFGFPRRNRNDFRYNKYMGGGALLDCGGYTLKLADMLLGGHSEIKTASVQYDDYCDVDISGSATLSNSDHATAQVSFGMDNDYRCSIDIWGSTGTLNSNRILTAPAEYIPKYTVLRNGEAEEYTMEADDTFLKSLDVMFQCIHDIDKRNKEYDTIIRQAQLVEQFRKFL